MGQDGIKEATVAIFGLRSGADRSQVDPTNVSGDLHVLLDVQANDETVTGVALMLDDEVISCRGTSSDQAIGLAGSGGQLEIECSLATAKAPGRDMCEGHPLAPAYLNGNYALGARITTADGATRHTFATQTLTLKNRNYVELVHHPGKAFVLPSSTTGGNQIWYGGPDTTAANLNSFSACPVLFDEDVVIGTIITGDSGFRGSPSTMTFLAPSPNNPLEHAGSPVGIETPPYTWELRPEWNWYYEANGAVNLRVLGILDPEGNDIRDKFTHRGAGSTLASIPSPGEQRSYRFDFKPPLPYQIQAPLTGRTLTATNASRVQVGYYDTNQRRWIASNIADSTHYSDNVELRGGGVVPQRFYVNNVWEAGSGLVSRGISVGDCDVKANTDAGARGTATPFVAIVDAASGIGDLPEEDALQDGFDRAGVNCYVAELQTMTDRLGNDARALIESFGVRVQGDAPFGVDRTAPEISDQEPDEPVALRNTLAVGSDPPVAGTDLATLTFSTADPKLESGDPGTGVVADSIRVYTGTSFSSTRRTWGNYLLANNPQRSTQDPATYGAITERGDVTVYLDSLAEGRTHTVNVHVPDDASPRNWARTTFTFTLDNTAPGWVASDGTSSGTMNARTATAVDLRVVGTVSDASVIDDAVLTVRAGSAGSCSHDDSSNAPLATSGDEKRLGANGFDLSNGSNKIDVDEVLRISAPASRSSEVLCITIEAEDSAVDSRGRGPGNTAALFVAEVTVQW